MNSSYATAENVTDDIARAVGCETGFSQAAVFTFGEMTQFIEELLKMLDQPSCRLVCIGHATPDIAIAADRAEVKLVEVLNDSPFVGDLSSALKKVESSRDIVYIANPNRVTGASFTLSELKCIAESVPDGAVIVDEYLYDFYGISGMPLVSKYDNVVVLRSFAARCGHYCMDTGYAIAGEHLMSAMRRSIRPTSISRSAHRTILSATADREGLVIRLKEIHDEALRIATELTTLGIQCRITATDFLLMRVASPKDVGNYLGRSRVTIENLHGYPLMKNYVRYQIESPASNDRLLDTFRRMPDECYRIAGFDGRAVALHRRRGIPGVNRMKQRTPARSAAAQYSERTISE